MRPIPHAAGVYLAVLQLVFTLGWTVYATYLPRLAASVGLSAAAVAVILMLDQLIFTFTDFAMGVAADKVSRLVGRLGHWVAAVTLVSCLAFAGLPLIAGAGLGPIPLLALIVVWAATSSALRAPPLMLLGKYAARPAVPYLAALAMLGIGVAGAISPYLGMTLAGRDPRLPFAVASAVLVLTSLALAKVERLLAKSAEPARTAPPTIDRAVPAPIAVFGATIAVFALGYQLHTSFNTAPLFQRFHADLSTLSPTFWIGFSVGMFPASLITRRWGGLPVMGAAGLLGAAAIVLAESSATLGLTVAAQIVAGAAWGAILMSAFTAACALGAVGAEGMTTGLLYSTLAIATFARVAAAASGALAEPALAPLMRWTPAACWALAGALLVALTAARRRPKASLS